MCMYKQDLALNNLEVLIYYKAQPTNVPPFFYVYVYIGSGHK